MAATLPIRVSRAALFAATASLSISVAGFAAVGAETAHTTKSVSYEDLANDDKTTNDVLTYGMGQHMHRYSTLDQINVNSVAGLKPKWSFSFGDEKQRGQEGQALVHDGVIYITASYSRIFALDAKSGKRLWSYSARLPDDIRPCCDVVSRGAAIYGDKVFFGQLDGSMTALNKDTGKVIWTKKFDDHEAGYAFTGAPSIIKDQKTGKILLIHGNSGDEFGAVGKLYARDPDTGEEIWMRPLVEGHMGRLNGKDSTTTGDANAPSWPNNAKGEKVEAWHHGGGAPWQTAAFDAKTNTIVVGSGNPAPWNAHYRTPGDSLFTSGQAYVDPTTGNLIGFFSHTPNDAWDFSGNNPILLFDYEKDGKTVRAGAHADRNGFLFITDLDKLTERKGLGSGDVYRQAGSALAIWPFVRDINWTNGWDLASGRPNEPQGKDSKRPPAPLPGKDKGEAIKVTPNFLGGTNWMPMSYNQDTKLFYIPSNDWTEDYWTENVTYKKGAAYLGQGFRIHRLFDDHIGALRAVDPTNGKIVWEALEHMPLWAGTLTTKGGLVITGTSDGYVKAFDAKNGKELWKFQTGSGVVSQPVTWETDGKQYIGIASGYGGAVPLWGGDMADQTKQVSQGGSFWVFEVPQTTAAN